MSRIYAKDLTRRIATLEARATQSTPAKRNVQLDIAIRAMAAAWTPGEIEKILAAAECHELTDLPADLCRRWVEHLDRIALTNFGTTFAALLPHAVSGEDRPRALCEEQLPVCSVLRPSVPGLRPVDERRNVDVATKT